MAAAYIKLATDLKIKQEAPARIVFARDTRPSGPALVAALVDGLEAVGAEYTDYGYFTTPQLHYVTRCINTRDTPHDYGEPTEEGYNNKLARAFRAALKHRRSTGTVTVDCANGVGGPKFHEVVKLLPTAKDGGLDLKVTNDNVQKSEILNSNVSVTDASCSND